jgi:GNAT superfamily N-acetyltransferase
MSQNVELLRGNGEVVTGIICPMNQNHLEDVNVLWKPMLQEMEEEDAFWDWAFNKRISLTRENYEAYAVEQDRLTHGLLWLETRNHRSQRIRGQPLVYVEAITSAPWNRRLLNPDPYFRGIGALLLKFARRRSIELGYSGRLGLHSLLGATSFYEEQGMTNMGTDPDYDDLVYFEFAAIRQAEEERVDEI